IYVVTLLKTGHNDQALRFLDYFINDEYPHFYRTSDILQRISAMSLLTEIRKQLVKKKNSDWSDFDLFGNWYSDNTDI
ncbi:MAG: hypothetical protein K2M12_02670, partial [Muribaculaceae bacterium]|nr:hypothetical protein [Muribaculaceae bacterium]